VVKLCVSRIRPDNFFLAGGGSADSGLATFSGWLPLLSIDSSGQSFPSAHMATAVGLAIGLSWLVPRGRWVFPTLALLVGVQRLQSGAHYLSDLCCGAAIGILTARACMSQRCLARHFDRLEGWYARRQRRLATGQSSPSLESRPARELVVPEGLPARRAA
jgi:membrane-associated phospholipid phosphatase